MHANIQANKQTNKYVNKQTSTQIDKQRERVRKMANRHLCTCDTALSKVSPKIHRARNGGSVSDGQSMDAGHLCNTSVQYDIPTFAISLLF